MPLSANRIWEKLGEGKEDHLAMSIHDMEKAQSTYGGFMNALKYSIPVIAVIVLIVVGMIAE